MMIPGLDVVPSDGDANAVLELKSFNGTFCIPRSKIYGGCRRIVEFEKVALLKTSPSYVWRKCLDQRSGMKVCVKKTKVSASPEQDLKNLKREIEIVSLLKNDNIMNFLFPAVGESLQGVYLIFEDSKCFLNSLLDQKDTDWFEKPVIHNIAMQLFRALDYIHKHDIMHRDVHAENLIFNQEGCLKLANFENAREFDSKDLTLNVTSKNYLAPELLLKAETHGPAVDIWAAGCLMCDFFLRDKNIFSGKEEVDIIQSIFNILGMPSENRWPGYSKLPGWRELDIGGRPHMYNCIGLYFKRFCPQTAITVDFFMRLFVYCPSKRMTASQCIQHKFFLDPPTACSQESMTALLERSKVTTCVLESTT